MLLTAGVGLGGVLVRAQEPAYATSQVIGQLATNTYATPVQQLLTPAGRQVELPGLRPQVLALSPDGRLLVASGKTPELVVIDPVLATVRQRVPLPSDRQTTNSASHISARILEPDEEAQASYTGLAFSPDGKRLYLASVNGSIKVFRVEREGTVAGLASFDLPPATAPTRKTEIPAGLAVSKDGRRLYVALSLSNLLLEMDATNGKALRAWKVGLAPYDVALAGDKIYVSNWGGRQPNASSVTGPAGRGTRVRVDPVRFIASEGSVSVVNLKEPPGDAANTASPAPAGEAQGEILTGLHASALAFSPNGRWLVVANAGSDTLSVIDTRHDEIIETVPARRNPADLFGAQPNALAFDKSGRRLFAANGTQNAVAVFDFRPGKSRWAGLIPVGWFPGAVVVDARRSALYVANIKGIGSGKPLAPGAKVKFNSHQHQGSVSLVPMPSAKELAAQTQVALDNLRYPLLETARLPARPGRPPCPVPERVGEPSVFDHVVYIIKENRTYDQVLGDVKAGNGDPSLCVFGERITPNQHRLVRDFVLLDNTYCSGVLSADGHQWATTAMATDYMEKSFAGFPRSYPDGMDDDDNDALAYSPAGFIWDNVLAHGKTLRDYGEFAVTEKSWVDRKRKGSIRFSDHWRDFTNGTQTVRVSSRPSVESLRPYLATQTVGWDLNIPDVFRAAQFIAELKAFETNGRFPNLVIICLPNDHTSGTKAGAPTPAAQVADNDLAFGRIVEAISHSRFWPRTCILAIEDDPQSGWDHVSAYRTTAYVISPYTRRHQVVSTQYNQLSLIRTMELILGLPPMNQMDATATPMTDCFMTVPDLTPFAALPNNVPLDELNPEPKKVSDSLLRRHAQLSAKLPLNAPDQCPEDPLNRILWHAMTGARSPYPEWAAGQAEDGD